MSKSIEVRDDAYIDWMYPEIYGDEKPKNKLVITLSHVRAANNIEIEYNSDTDGWDIFQTFDDYENSTSIRKHKAFVPAWESEDETF